MDTSELSRGLQRCTQCRREVYVFWTSECSQCFKRYCHSDQLVGCDEKFMYLCALCDEYHCCGCKAD